MKTFVTQPYVVFYKEDFRDPDLWEGLCEQLNLPTTTKIIDLKISSASNGDNL